ncbi:hypothetical protein QE152_g18032 [Popillia japonica]|uniref:Uncharacterized protein n=1 Tax=Popillia japonica TaxID=7064 RepID=A0AAW1L5S0_POPJA
MSVARSSLLLLRRPPAVRQMKPPPSLPPPYLAFVESEGDVKYDLCCPTIVINAVPFGFEIAVRSHLRQSLSTPYRSVSRSQFVHTLLAVVEGDFPPS